MGIVILPRQFDKIFLIIYFLVLFSQFFRFTIIRAVAVGIGVVVHPGKNTRSELRTL